MIVASIGCELPLHTFVAELASPPEFCPAIGAATGYYYDIGEVIVEGEYSSAST